MPDQPKTLIMKFGGAAVQSPESFGSIAKIIFNRQKKHSKIVIVVSAMGDMTNELISLAHRVNPTPPKREYDMLVSTGERISVSLLAMALAKLGCEAISFTGSQSGIMTTNDHTAAKIVEVRPQRLIEALKNNRVVIVAGFQGVSFDKEITTLGRGGSDTTAVALGIALEGRVEFYKEVEGIFDTNPKKHPPKKLYAQLNYDEAIEIVQNSGGQVLHPRALLLAKQNHLPLHLYSFLDPENRGTQISHGDGKLRAENVLIFEK